MPSALEVSFDASGAADAGARHRVVCVVDVTDASTSAEAALDAGALAVLGAARAGSRLPVPCDPAAVGQHAATVARESGADAVIVTEPRIGSRERRIAAARTVLEVLEKNQVGTEVVANQGAELPALAHLEGRVVIIVSATGGAAFDAALAADAPAACFATTARIEGRSGWEVARLGAHRAAELAQRHRAGLSVVAASANSADDCLGAFEIARILAEDGRLRG
jgi:hypothetical protein